MSLTSPHSIDEMLALLLAENYIAERSLADLSCRTPRSGPSVERTFLADGTAIATRKGLR